MTGQKYPRFRTHGYLRTECRQVVVSIEETKETSLKIERALRFFVSLSGFWLAPQHSLETSLLCFQAFIIYAIM